MAGSDPPDTSGGPPREADELAHQLVELDHDELAVLGYDLGIFPPDLEPLDEHGLVGLGGELSVLVILEAYAKGIFPWTGKHPIPWCSPDPRLILEPRGFRRSRSLRKTLRDGAFVVTFDTAYPEVMQACAAAVRDDQDGTWITDNMHRTYGALHLLGYAHSVEVWRADAPGELVGGLYGLSLGRAFFGESMFHRATDASKVCLVHLHQRLSAGGFRLLDVQWSTPHLAQFGVVEIGRDVYLEHLEAAIARPAKWPAPTDLSRQGS